MMKNLENSRLRTWIEIDRKVIRFNYKIFRKLAGGSVKIMGVVKSNAYGHSLIEFARELEELGVDALAVDSLVEALTLRKSGIGLPVLVLGYTLPEMFSKAVGKNIHITISSTTGLNEFLKYPKANKIPIHLKVDTGMHRQGFLLEEMDTVLKMILWSSLRVVGLYTHFASAKEPNSHDFTNKQIAELELWRSELLDIGFTGMVHSGATGGTVYFPKSHLDMVRIGAGLYGFWPCDEKLSLRPALSWKTIISEIKEIPVGHGVGYDLTHRTDSAARIAVCPIGYWHGYPRLLSNNADVLVRGARAKVIGRVSMDMIVIDVTNIPRVKVGDEVVLIGKSGKEDITSGELASLAGTSPYEILTRLNPLMKRIYKN